MRPKRTHPVPVPAPAAGRLQDDEHPPDATGLTIDWIGVSETGGGGQLLPAWLVAGLAAARAVPFLVWRAAARLIGRGGRRDDPRAPIRRE